MDDFSSAALGANFKGWHEKIKLRKDGFNQRKNKDIFNICDQKYV